MILVFSVSIKVYNNLHQCFHSKENIYKESSIVDKHINHIQFNVVSGFVYVDFHNRSDIFIRVWDNARTRDHVDSNTFDSGVSINNTSVVIHSVTPAFNFRSCQHAKIEISIPKNYPTALSMSGIIKVGMFHIEGKDQFLDNVDINVEVGKIDVVHLVANTLSLTSEIGFTRARKVWTLQSTKIQSHTGIIRTSDVITNSFKSVTQFGCSKHNDLSAENAKIETRFGFTSVIKATGKHLDLSLNTEYGKSFVLIDSTNVTFNLGTTKGKMKVKYEEEKMNCKVDKSVLTAMKGSCDVKAGESNVKVDIDTKYGKAALVVGANGMKKKHHYW